MASAGGPPGPSDDDSKERGLGPVQTFELQLFESLIHHLIEKGVLTKNDALSIVQTVAEVKRGQRESRGLPAATAASDLIALQRVYSSFDILAERTNTTEDHHGGNVLQLRPPLHADKPKFPLAD